jgi:hypothetical protein
MAGEVLMMRLFSVHVHDTAVIVRLQSICVAHRGAPAGRACLAQGV